jgi:hypothetical protein
MEGGCYAKCMSLTEEAAGPKVTTAAGAEVAPNTSRNVPALGRLNWGASL